MSNHEYGFRHGPTNTNTPRNGINEPGNSRFDKSDADVTKTVASAAHQAVDAVTEKAAEAERKLREGAATNEQALREAADKATLKANQLKSQAHQYVNEKPFAAAGIAFLAGIATAAWLRK